MLKKINCYLLLVVFLALSYFFQICLIIAALLFAFIISNGLSNNFADEPKQIVIDYEQVPIINLLILTSKFSKLGNNHSDEVIDELVTSTRQIVRKTFQIEKQSTEKLRTKNFGKVTFNLN